MLEDLKSFVVGSSVAEVGVGLSVGAAFTALVTAVVGFAKDGIHGEWAFAGISTAAIALGTVLLVSLIGVVRPLMRLRSRVAGGAQAEATTGAAVEAAATTDEIPVASADVPAEATAAGRAADVPVTAEAAGQAAAADAAVAFAADPLRAPIPVQVARNAALGSAASVALGSTAAAAAASWTAAAPAPVEEPVVDLTHALVGVPAQQAEVAAEPAVPAASVPFRAADLVACPHCAFDVPAAASRCGWCTSDLRVPVSA